MSYWDLLKLVQDFMLIAVTSYVNLIFFINHFLKLIFEIALGAKVSKSSNRKIFT